jgi:hypothetical protein
VVINVPPPPAFESRPARGPRRTANLPGIVPSTGLFELLRLNIRQILESAQHLPRNYYRIIRSPSTPSWLMATL